MMKILPFTSSLVPSMYDLLPFLAAPPSHHGPPIYMQKHPGSTAYVQLPHSPPQSSPPQSCPPQSGPPQSGPPQSSPPQSGPPQSGPPQSCPPQSGPPQYGPV